MAKANFKCLSATTKSNAVETHYTWTIHNISLRIKDERELQSTSFESDAEARWSWYFTIKQVDGLVKFGLSCDSNSYPFSIPRVPTEFQFSLLAPNGEQNLEETYFRIFSNAEKCHYTNPFSPSKLLEQATDPGDKIIILCRVRQLLNELTTNNSPKLPCNLLHDLERTVPISPCKMQHDLESILKDPQFADVTLVVEGNFIKAHKAILSARSPVFAAMFSSDMMETHQNQVIIPDMDLEVAQQLLRFIYTGNAEIKANMADGLLAAADKYGLIRLKEICERTVISNTTIAIPTATKTLIFADRMNAKHLKSHTMKFIKANMEEVMESDDWKTMVAEHPKLLIEVCRMLSNKQPLGKRESTSHMGDSGPKKKSGRHPA